MIACTKAEDANTFLLFNLWKNEEDRQESTNKHPVWHALG
jgi:hypothetical protein